MLLAIRPRKRHGLALTSSLIGKNGERFFELFSSGRSNKDKHNPTTLPSHVKFRMPDLNFKVRRNILRLMRRKQLNLMQEVGCGDEEIKLTKWYVREGATVKDGTHMCEIDTPDLSFQLESGDEGFVAQLLVAEGTTNISPNQPLAIIVPSVKNIESFRYGPLNVSNTVEAEEEAAISSSVATSSERLSSSDVLRMLNKLQKEGLFGNESKLKLLKSLARKSDERLLTTFKASYVDGLVKDSAFDKAFFVENALELAEEAAVSRIAN
ncbi:hypothetical protein CCR75_001811 [Bremia lactucae]|uniref:Lipoyl-binding domain-containing protein n=1 Tax=Bremia lactucae TaxID=4779 RepID=A0A976FFP7_BRELC|nr:hypothetical protein CCR75_001811 [Bremia lactucae]